ncbi:MAG: hypothetical protein QXW35_03610 [Candidatus Aenigmatarchaeota archaeon]
MAKITEIKISFDNPKNLGLLYTGKNPYYIENFIPHKDGTLKAFPKLNFEDTNSYHSPFKSDLGTFIVKVIDNYDYLINLNTNALFKLGLTDYFTTFGYFNNNLYIASKNYGIITYPDQQLASSIIQPEDATTNFLSKTIPIPKLQYITFGFGRLYGFIQDTLYFSEVYFPMYMLPSNYIKFPDDIMFVYTSSQYIYVGTKNFVYIINPEDHSIKKHISIKCLYGKPAMINNILYFLSQTSINTLNEYTTELIPLHYQIYDFNFPDYVKYNIFIYEDYQLVITFS